MRLLKTGPPDFSSVKLRDQAAIQNIPDIDISSERYKHRKACQLITLKTEGMFAGSLHAQSGPACGADFCDEN